MQVDVQKDGETYNKANQTAYAMTRTKLNYFEGKQMEKLKQNKTRE